MIQPCRYLGTSLIHFTRIFQYLSKVIYSKYLFPFFISEYQKPIKTPLETNKIIFKRNGKKNSLKWHFKLKKKTSEDKFNQVWLKRMGGGVELLAGGHKIIFYIFMA